MLSIWTSLLCCLAKSLKVLADGNLDMYKMICFVQRIQSIYENGGNNHVLLFPQSFQKASFS